MYGTKNIVRKVSKKATRNGTMKDMRKDTGRGPNLINMQGPEHIEFPSTINDPWTSNMQSLEGDSLDDGIEFPISLEIPNWVKEFQGQLSALPTIETTDEFEPIDLIPSEFNNKVFTVVDDIQYNSEFEELPEEYPSAYRQSKFQSMKRPPLR
jgi:hypothetical protein